MRRAGGRACQAEGVGRCKGRNNSERLGAERPSRRAVRRVIRGEFREEAGARSSCRALRLRSECGLQWGASEVWSRSADVTEGPCVLIATLFVTED